MRDGRAADGAVVGEGEGGGEGTAGGGGTHGSGAVGARTNEGTRTKEDARADEGTRADRADEEARGGGTPHRHPHRHPQGAERPAEDPEQHAHATTRSSRPVRALVITASNRAAAGVYPDTGGPLIAERLKELGFTVGGPQVVPDGDPVEQALRAGAAAGYDVILTTGGTGISPTDATPEATRTVIDYEVPGIAEAIRAFGRRKVATSALSRGLAGVAGRTLIVNLPGSTGGVRDGLAVLEPLLPHAVEQLRGADHRRPTPSAAPAWEVPGSTH